jgi:hypothetical protein
MRILCRSDERDVQAICGVCGQGFVLFWGDETPGQQAEAFQEIETTLRNHHRNNVLPDVHPEYFLVPEWHHPVGFYGAAELGNPPARAW